MKNGNTPAMPQDRGIWVDGIGDCPTLATGLTKREHFAAMAMQAIVSVTPHETIKHLGSLGDVIAESALRIADDLLAELEKHNDQA